MAWKYRAINDFASICLHDCWVTHIGEQGNAIIFGFSDGFWIVETNVQNPYKRTLRTGKSKLAFLHGR
ncbi:MAG: hypothetical protein FWD73_17630 [Polyangiaceae bacterium]|nr:hypothetical protein [Polyangiaceae bacterium]